MSPWWSRPTADDDSEDKKGGKRSRSDEGREPVEAADIIQGEEGGSGEQDTSGRRRRRRRSSSKRSSSTEKKSDQKASKKSDQKKGKSQPEQRDDKGGSKPEASGRRRRRRRSSREKGDDSGKGGARKKEKAKSSKGQQKQDSSSSKKKGSSSKSDSSADKQSKQTSKGRRETASDARTDESFEFDGSPADIEQQDGEIDLAVPERNQSMNDDERKIALFCDLENIALGVRDSKEVNKFDIHLVLERLLEKGKIIVKKAYCDWERYNEYKRPFHEAAIELIDIPQKYYSGKNSADIKMVVDAMDLSYSKEHLDTFVLLSGDSDFSPLVSKLKENNKYVIGIGVKGSSANLLIDNCDEFIYYEDVWRNIQSGPKLEGLSKKEAEVFGLLIDSIQALIRENKDVLWGSMIKQTMQRKKPSFNEGYYGYSTFSELLEDAAEKNVVRIKKDQRSGSYVITGFANRKPRRK